jgi:hypothetical protein
VRGSVLEREEDPMDIDAERLFECVERKVGQRADGENAGIRDDEVEAAERVRRVLQALLDLRLVGDVERAGPDAIARAAKRLGNALDGFAVPVGDRNRGSLLAESPRSARAWLPPRHPRPHRRGPG